MGLARLQRPILSHEHVAVGTPDPLHRTSSRHLMLTVVWCPFNLAPQACRQSLRAPNPALSSSVRCRPLTRRQRSSCSRRALPGKWSARQAPRRASPLPWTPPTRVARATRVRWARRSPKPTKPAAWSRLAESNGSRSLDPHSTDRPEVESRPEGVCRGHVPIPDWADGLRAVPKGRWSNRCGHSPRAAHGCAFAPVSTRCPMGKYEERTGQSACTGP